MYKAIPAVYCFHYDGFVNNKNTCLNYIMVHNPRSPCQSPHMNTLYVNIGQLYPRADFAGVLINLNMNKAINRGKSALNLTNLSSYTTSKTNYGQILWGHKNIHFLALKRTTDLYEITDASP